MHDVIVVGSANLDLVAATPRIPRPGETIIGTSYAEFAGGKGLNQAIAASRDGADTALVATVGSDAAGTSLLAVANDNGIDTAYVACSDALPSGRALIMVDERGENSIVAVPGANAETSGRAIPAGTVVLAQLEVAIDAVTQAFAAARQRGSTTILNPAPAAALPAELVRLTDILIPNEHEAERMGGIHELLDAGVQTVIVTRGSRGVAVTTRSAGQIESWSVAAIPVDAIDTTGAGDAFCGCLAAAIAAGPELRPAIQRAVAAGALATTTLGAVPSLPTTDRIDQLLTR
ncbi:MAG: ribokinase [Acidimicrobiia bacterium]|nr:ribokinase [Acidimicrobiia bacterium]